MNEMLKWGTEINIWLQQFSPALDIPFKAVTFCGEELFFLIFLPLIYWSINRAAGVRLLLLFLVSAWANSAVKILAADPRPYQFDSGVKGLQHVDSYGFPSGHTQGAVTVWGYLVYAFKKKWLLVLAIAMIILVPLSRLYLGVHDMPDLIGGYLIGFILLFAFIKFEPLISALLNKYGLGTQLAVSIVIPAAMVAFSPEFDEGCITAAATLMGMSTGFVLERRYVYFASSGTVLKRAMRYIMGLIVIIGLWIGLKIAFKGMEPALLFRFIRYLLIGLWGSFGAPWVFVKLSLAETDIKPKT